MVSSTSFAMKKKEKRRIKLDLQSEKRSQQLSSVDKVGFSWYSFWLSTYFCSNPTNSLIQCLYQCSLYALSSNPNPPSLKSAVFRLSSPDAPFICLISVHSVTWVLSLPRFSLSPSPYPYCLID